VVGAFEPILAALGGLLAAVALIAQHLSGGTVTLHYSVDDWKADGDGWVLKIPSERHGRRNPTAVIGKQTEHGWTEVYANPFIEADATITIRIDDPEGRDTRFDCEVRVN
jgi:hypothetical protein